MPFPPEVAERLLVACHRHCCICHKFCGTRIEVHHIVPKSQGGADTEENGIPLCFDCHAEAESYNPKHPKGRRFTPSELRGHKKQWFRICQGSPWHAPAGLSADLPRAEEKADPLTLSVSIAIHALERAGAALAASGGAEAVRALLPNGVELSQIADLLAAEAGGAGGDRMGSSRHRRGRNRGAMSAQVVPPSQLRILGIIAVSPIPRRLADFKKLFPETTWESQVKSLQRKGLVQRKEGRLTVPGRVARSLRKDPDDERQFVQAWIDALEPIREHPDTALFLATQYVHMGRFGDAVDTLADVAEALGRGKWIEVYCSCLLTLNRPRVLRLIGQQQRVRFFNAIGLCLAGCRRYQEAVPWFLRLRRYSKRIRHLWGEGQSYINCGVAYHELRDSKRAERCFLKAIEHAEENGDPHLLGRALHDLAMVIVGSEPTRAAQLLDASAAAKKKADDRFGLVGVYVGRGIVQAKTHGPGPSLRWFRRAIRLAKRLDDQFGLAMGLCNLGCSLYGTGDHEGALSRYQEARRIADEQGFLEAMGSVLLGEALTLDALRRYERAERAFRELDSVLRSGADLDAAATALHGIGVALLHQGKADDARRALVRACRFARKHAMVDWVLKCRQDYALTYVEGDGDPEKACAYLRRAAESEEEGGAHDVAVDLYELLVNILIDSGGRASEIAAVCQRSLSCLDQIEGSTEARIRPLRNLHVAAWQDRDYDRALNALRESAAVARQVRDQEWECRATDQLGVCLQELGRFPDAEVPHKKALKLARELASPELEANCLNNLGELYRRTGREAKAVEFYIQAEAIARDTHDAELAISVAHNRALALEKTGRSEQASCVMRRCREKARQKGIWRKYVEALHGLADLMWAQNGPAAARTSYAKALAAARKYGVEEEKWGISINYAAALRWSGQVPAAIEVLESAGDPLAALSYDHKLLIDLASAYGDVGKMDEARTCWEAALPHAQRAGDVDAVAHTSGALAEIYEGEGQLDRADEALQRAIMHEAQPDLRATLLVQRVSVLTKVRKWKAANEVFATAVDLCLKHELYDSFVDAHLMAGDANWNEGRSQLGAMKFYVAALAMSGDCEPGATREVIMHVLHCLHSIPSGKRQRRIRKLQGQLVTWISRDFLPRAKASVAAFLLLPFRVAERLDRKAPDWADVPAKEWDAIIAAEL